MPQRDRKTVRMAEDRSITITYAPNVGQISDYVVGFEHQAYQNYRMMFDRSWDRHFWWIRTNLSFWSAVVAGLICSVTLASIPGARASLDYWILAPAPLVAIAVWLVLWIGSKKSNREYSETIARWNIEQELAFSPHYDVKIGPTGFRQVTRIYTIELSWAMYHHAILQPDNLVLVFQGTVAVIPNTAMPTAPQDIVNHIHLWSAAQQNEIKPLVTL